MPDTGGFSTGEVLVIVGPVVGAMAGALSFVTLKLFGFADNQLAAKDRQLENKDKAIVELQERHRQEIAAERARNDQHVHGRAEDAKAYHHGLREVVPEAMRITETLARVTEIAVDERIGPRPTTPSASPSGSGYDDSPRTRRGGR